MIRFKERSRNLRVKLFIPCWAHLTSAWSGNNCFNNQQGCWTRYLWLSLIWRKFSLEGHLHWSLHSFFIALLLGIPENKSFSKSGRHLTPQMRESTLGEGSGNQILDQQSIKTTAFFPLFFFLKCKRKHTVKKKKVQTELMV